MTIKAKPARIVSLAATATEDLYAVGAGTQVVAVDSGLRLPARGAGDQPERAHPNLEAIAKYDPGLVIASQDTAAWSPGSASSASRC